ncbi:MAG: PKD domain-containing protein [Bacteroidetes bacterium]|nr:PKD domain-containing protein [Bacteroidota bacterium]
MKLKITTLLMLISSIYGLYAKSVSPPSAQFNASAFSGCAPLTVTFYNSSIGGPGVYNWNFGDPLSGTQNIALNQCSPVHTFQNPGTYTVTLTYVSGAGTFTITHNVVVNPRPNPGISGQDTVCDGSTHTYTASGTPGSTWLWSAIGGTINGSATGSSVSVSWPTPGVQQLNLTETNTFGCSRTRTIKILVANQPRLGDICADRKGTHQGNPDKPSQLACLCQWSTKVMQALDPNSQLLSNSIYTFQWIVTGGTVVSGQGTNTASIQVGAGPTMTVTIIASNPFGCTDTQTCIYDVCPSPKASFKADTACLTGASHLNASASTVLANIDSFVWDFGSGNVISTNGPLVSYTFLTPGLHPVKLTVFNKARCSDDTVVWVLVKPGDAPPIDCKGTVCHHSQRCYHTPYFAGATYIWSATGGVGTPSVQGDSFCVNWGSGPIGTVSVEVIGGPYLCGKNTIDIPIFPDTIKILGQDTVCVGSWATFSTHLIPGSCYNWTVTTPGGVTTAVNPTTNPGNTIGGVINQPGIYTITLSMDNPLTCCKGRATRQIVAQGPIQVFNINNVCEYTTQTYTSNVPVVWGPMGNGTIMASSPTSVTIAWGSATSGTIHCTAINPNLVCDNDASFQVTLIPRPPNPAINGPNVVCKGSTFIYSFDSLPSISACSWSVTPAGAAYNAAPVKSKSIKWNTVGTYTITVTYTGQAPYFCTSTSTLQVSVVDTACMTITGSPNACIGQTYTYTIPSNPGNAWQLNAIGGNIVLLTSTSITVTWGNINQGQITLQNKVCPKMCVKKVNIFAIPTGTITVGKGSCKGDTVRLTAPPGYLQYSWSPGGATTRSIVVNSTGTYTCTITGPGGCTAVLTQIVSPVPKLPKPNVNVSYNCMVGPSLPLPYQMTATYNAAWYYAWSPQTAIPAASDTIYQHYSTVQNSTHTVIVTNEYGCKDTASVTLSASCTTTQPCPNPPCTPCSTPCNAVVNPSYDPCNGQFTATVTSGSPIAYYWDFGDGYYSNLQNPQHWYYNTGTYTVLFNYFCNCTWVTIKMTVNVPYILRPKIKHTFPINCNYKTIQLAYTPTSVVTGTGVSWNVDWGDGSGLYAGSLPVNHTYNYTTDTTFIITYTVTAPNPSCTKVVKDTVKLKYFDADFTMCGACVGQSMQFVDISSSPVPIVQWAWTFGDLTGSNLQSPFHIYNTVNTFNPKLVITNQQGCKDSQTYSITTSIFNAGALTYTINNIAAIPVSPGVYQICEGQKFVAAAPVGAGWTYSWNNGVSSKNDTLTQSGLYWVVISNGNGCTDTLGPFQLIVNPKPNATILAPDSVCSNTFSPLQALQGAGYQYNWSSNPAGLTGTGSTAYWFGMIGTNTVYLQVTSAAGCIAWDTATLVSLPAPQVSLSLSNTGYICQGDSATLTATITGSYTSVVWSTGQTGVLSIRIFGNGVYTCTVTNASGCSEVSTYYVNNFVPRPDLSNVPKGCYRVCKSANPITLCGPYPVGTQVLQYQWFLNNNLYATTQNISITSPGNYYLVCVDATTGCASTSEVFNVQFVAGPVAKILTNSPNPVICVNSPGGIVMCAQNPQPGVIYTWTLLQPPNWLATGNCYTATQPGTYVLHAFYSHCCESWDTLKIDTGDCCFPPGTVYTLVQDSTVISTSTVWNGKYYIAGRVYVRQTAILDLTEVDCVFDRDGEIIFEDSTIIRANNSVFRPCDMNDIWVGFTFKDKSQGLIHTSLYKNARHAVDIRNTKNYSVRITDNTFSNCNVGIQINKSGNAYREGITDNTFVIENTNFNVPGLYGTNDFWGIKLLNTSMEEMVSQNFFRNSDRSKQPNRYFGIYMQNSSGTMSSNTFTNMYRSIDVAGNNGVVTIENNTMEQTLAGVFPAEVQIRLSNLDRACLVFANNLRNSDNADKLNTAIFAHRCYLLNIRDNNIKGFKTGIWTRLCTKSLVNENDIDLTGDVGILDSASQGHDISCNIVRMKDYQGTGVHSVGIYMFQGNSGNRIYTNCIFDTRYAIYVRHTTPFVTIPQIFNNYMYNFQIAGIQVQNHSGTIGNSGNPGRNTFVCNNYFGGAYDIRNLGAGLIIQECNDGAAVTWNVVNNACPGNSMYSSTAACGQRIVNNKWYKLNHWDICDNYRGKSDLIDAGGTSGTGGIGIDVIKGNPVNLTPVAPDDQTAMLLILADLGNRTDFDKAMNLARQAAVLSPFTLGYMEARWLYKRGDAAAAIAAIKALNPETDQELALQTVTAIVWNSAGSELSTNDQHALKAIDNAANPVSSIARDVLHSYQGNQDYIFGAYSLGDEDANAGKLNGSQFVKLIPNPAQNEVDVEFAIAGFKANVELYDIHGQLTQAKALGLSEGRYRFDLRHLSPGMYIVRVTDIENSKTYSTKLIKK